MLFEGLLAAAEGVLLDFGGDLFGTVAHEDRARLNRRRHLGARPLQGVEEPRMDQRRLGIAQLSRDISSQAKVWVLIDS